MRVHTPKPKQKPHRWPWLIGSGVFITCCIYVLVLLSWPVQAIHATQLTYTPPVITPSTIVWPSYGQGAFGAEGYGVVSSSSVNATTVPMASITKVITALTVLQVKPIPAGQTGPVITFSAADAALYNQYIAKDGSVVRADAGLQLTEYQVLQGMLISSANNYADSLAIWAYGSMDNYLAAAKTYLASQNLSQTTVADASGFSPDSKSTADNLVKLGMLALKEPVLKNIVSQKTVVLPGVGTLNNTNMLLGRDGVIGLKTGTTDEAGACLLYAANYLVEGKPITVVGATLGAPNHSTLFRDIPTVLTSGEKGFQKVQLIKSGQQFGIYKTPWGAVAHAVAKNELSEVVWQNAKITESSSLKSTGASSANKPVGTARFSANGKTYTSELVLDHELQGPSWQWRLLHPDQVL